MKKIKSKEYLIDAGFLIVGSLLYAISVKMFIEPSHLAPGGVTGIATVLHYLFNFPIGITMLILNIPLFIIAISMIGREFTVKTMVATVSISVIIDLLHMPEYKGNVFLACLYGGLISGAGLALIFLRGATTGGSDLAGRLIRKKKPHISMGRVILLIDGLVIASATIIFRNFEIALYSIISIYTSTHVIDSILYGADNGKLYMIISEKDKEIAETVATELRRGITLIKSQGYYSGNDRDLLMCVVRRPEAAKLIGIVKRIDPFAFVIATEAGQILGEGFRPITKDSAV